MNIYEMFMNNGLEDIFVMTRFTCGHSCGYSESMFFEDEEDEWNNIGEYIANSYSNKTTDMYSSYEIIGTILYLYIDKTTMCSKCIGRNNTIYCDDPQYRPTHTEVLTIYRGLNAYYGDDDKYKMIRLFEEMITNKEKQICCSTHILGDMGVTLTGEVLYISNIDLHSMKQGNRRYYMGRDKLEHVVYDARELKGNNKNLNDEIVMRNVNIENIWLDYNACEAAVEAAKHLAHKYNVKIIRVRTSKRFAR